MTGLEIAKAYYETYGAPMLKEQFPELSGQIAAGLIGSGSECFGYDDEVSRDHDFEPGFCLFLPGEDAVDRRTAFLLERAYAKLPKEFMGIKRDWMQPVGGARRGVLRTADFFRQKVGSEDGVLTLSQWFSVPESALAEAVNGDIFYDGSGAVTRIREGLAFYPEPVRRKKLAGKLLLMAQSGQYNYRRCVAHGETGAAQFAVVEFVQSAMAVMFLLSGVYQPYYKWRFRALRELPKWSLSAELMEYLLTTGNETESQDVFSPAPAEAKADTMESICAEVIDELQAQGLTQAICGDLEKHAYSVNDSIEDAEIRNLHILSAS